jgi:hypothetical protein
LGVIAYQLLTDRLPYDADVARAASRSQQRKLRYRSMTADERETPVWIDGAIRRAVDPDPLKRHEALSEFLFDLRNPNKLYESRSKPLLERDPLSFWKALSAFLTLVIVGLLAYLVQRH